MAFLPYSYDDGEVRPWEYLPAGAITPTLGMALTQTSGNLAVATGTTKPTYISMTERSAALTAGDIIPVIRVDSGIIFETTNTTALSGVNRGQRVTLHTDGKKVTATTSSGVAEIIDYDSKASAGAGGKVWVRF